MPNNGKALTNVAFRKKILEVIDKIKDQSPTSLVRHVDDFEGLNKDTFEAGMSALVDAIPAGGGGGGGGGDAGYTVTFGINFEAQSDEDLVTCDKTIEDIIAHRNEHVVGRFVIEGYPVEGIEGITFDFYCDNMKFDYQKMNTDIPEYLPMVDEYTYLGFSSDSAVLGLINGENPLDNEGPEYYKMYLKIYYLFNESTPCWFFSFEEIDNGGSEPTEVHTYDIDFPDDKTTDFVKSVTIKVVNSGEVGTGINNAELYWTSNLYSRAEAQFLESFLPEDLYESGFSRCALCSPTFNNKNGYAVAAYSKPAQFEVRTELESGHTWNISSTRGVFTVDTFSYSPQHSYGHFTEGYLEAHMDHADRDNNCIIRHWLKIEMYDYGGLPAPRTTYKVFKIPYTEVDIGG